MNYKIALHKSILALIGKFFQESEKFLTKRITKQNDAPANALSEWNMAIRRTLILFDKTFLTTWILPALRTLLNINSSNFFKSVNFHTICIHQRKFSIQTWQNRKSNMLQRQQPFIQSL